jgi:hypothetical protein
MVDIKLGSLVDEVLENNWDLGSLELRQYNVTKAANSIEWATNPAYINFEPWPRQIQILTEFFEDYCPRCSNMSVVRDMWGMPFREIENNVSFLRYGKCPNCGGTRGEFRAEGLHRGIQEIIGIAGQRCLDPETCILLANGTPILIQDVIIGDILKDKHGTFTSVLKKEVNKQPGYFKIFLRLPDGNSAEVKCGHEHLWITPTGERVSTELLSRDLIMHEDGWCEILGIEKIRVPKRMVDIETESKTFLGTNGVVYHNSGKTLLTGIISTYIGHRYLCLDGICANNFAGLRDTVLNATFVASDRSQVKDTTWEYFVNEVNKSSWFQNYLQYLKDEGKRLGVELYAFKEDLHLIFKHKKLMFEFKVADGTTLRGKTRFLCGIDELGWFSNREDAKVRSGKKTYAALSNSLRTVRTGCEARWGDGYYDLPTGYMISVSSPQAEDDPIMTLASNARDDKQTYNFHYATWEIAPHITRESLRSDFIKDPMAAQRDFAAIPGTGKDIFLPNVEMMHANIDDDKNNIIQYTHETFHQVVKGTVYNYVKAILQGLPIDRTVPYCLALDAGEVQNSFAIILTSMRDDKTSIDGLIQIKPVMVNTVGSIAAVHFPSVTDLIKEMARKVSIQEVIIDRWQSASIVHELRDVGIKAERYSLKYADLVNFKNRYLANLVIYPAPEIRFQLLMLEHLTDKMPIAQLLKQTRTVRDNGKQVLKPAQGDDDLFRCSVLADYIMNRDKKDYQMRLGISRALENGMKAFFVNGQIMRDLITKIQSRAASGIGNVVSVARRNSNR